MQETGDQKLPDIRKTARFKAPVQKVWKAVATADGIASWLMPNDFEARAGHDFTLQSPFGPVPCKVIEVDPPRRVSFSWDTFGWRVTIELREIEGGTELTLIHGGWGAPDELIPRVQQPNAVIHDTMNNGWETNVEKLRQVVDG